MSLKTFTIEVPIYNQCIYLLIGSCEDAIAHIEDIHKCEIEFKVLADGATLMINNCIYLWIPEEIGLSTIVHELGHVTFYLMDFIGLDIKDQEAFCYLQAFLLDEIWDTACIQMAPIRILSDQEDEQQ